MAAPIDLADGTTWQLGRIEMEASAVSAFAAAYDPQLQHLDEHAAKHTLLQGQAASGWHTCTVLMQQLKRHLHQRSLHVEVPAIAEIRWLRPVRPGDILEATVRWTSQCRVPGCGDREGWMAAIEAANQAGEPVLRISGNALLAEHRACPDLPSRARACAGRFRRSPRAVRRPGGHLVRYFEDVELGDEIALGTFDFTEDAVRAFADVIACSEPAVPASCSPDTPAPRVDGWHVVSAWMRLIVD